MYVCVCKGVTSSDVRRLGEAGIHDSAEIADVLELDDPECCGRCLEHMDVFVALAREQLSDHDLRTAIVRAFV